MGNSPRDLKDRVKVEGESASPKSRSATSSRTDRKRTPTPRSGKRRTDESRRTAAGAVAEEGASGDQQSILSVKSESPASQKRRPGFTSNPPGVISQTVGAYKEASSPSAPLTILPLARQAPQRPHRLPAGPPPTLHQGPPAPRPRPPVGQRSQPRSAVAAAYGDPDAPWKHNVRSPFAFQQHSTHLQSSPSASVSNVLSSPLSASSLIQSQSQVASGATGTSFLYEPCASSPFNFVADKISAAGRLKLDPRIRRNLLSSELRDLSPGPEIMQCHAQQYQQAMLEYQDAIEDAEAVMKALNYQKRGGNTARANGPVSDGFRFRWPSRAQRRFPGQVITTPLHVGSPSAQSASSGQLQRPIPWTLASGGTNPSVSMPTTPSLARTTASGSALAERGPETVKDEAKPGCLAGPALRYNSSSAADAVCGLAIEEADTRISSQDMQDMLATFLSREDLGGGKDPVEEKNGK